MGKLKNFFIDLFWWMVVSMFLAVIIWMVSSCSPRYITVPEYHYENHHSIDTFIQRDSVLKENNTIIREADSTMLEELGIRLKQGERAILVLRKELERVLNQQREVQHDTVIKIDSIKVPYPVEKELTAWQKIQINAGSIIIFLAVAVGLYWFFSLLKRKRKNR